MLDVKVTNKPGTSKIVYVMQSDVDSSLFIYIGKEFSMKDGNWTYAKYDMNGVTPLQLKQDLAKNGWHEVNPSTAPAKVIDDDLAEKRGVSGEDATVNDPENPMADCVAVKKIDCNKLADDLFDIANKFGDFIKNTQRAANDGETVKDDLIESSSEEALKKNIATEIEAGKDPKQAAAIAYSVQRENDAADEWIRGPRGTFKVVEGTKEDLRKDGYGFHHGFDANGKHYSVMVKNDEAVAVEDKSSVKDASNFKEGDKVRISENFHIESLQGVKGIVTSVYEDGLDIKEIEGPRKGEEHFWSYGNDIIKDSSIKDGHGILSSGQEATLRKYCDKYEVDFNRAYQEIERQLKRYPGKKVDDLIEGLLDDMVTGIFDASSVPLRDSLTVGGKYRWEKKFGNLPLELRNIDEYVLLAAGDKMASLKTEEFAKLLESGEVQSIGEGYLPEYSGIKTDYKVKVGDRMFIVRATSKEEARRKLIQSLDRKLN